MDHSACILPRVTITFSVQGDALNPNELTLMLGMQPSHACRKGDLYESKGPGIRPTGVWQLRSEMLLDSSDPNEHVNSVLRHLEGKRAEIDRLRSDPGYTVAAWIMQERDPGMGGFAIRSEFLARLAALCTEIVISVIIVDADA
jgi:hypothetical protein